MPNPMHPPPQLLRQLPRISLNTRHAHSKQYPRLPTRLNNTLGARAANLIVRVKDVGQLLGTR